MYQQIFIHFKVLCTVFHILYWIRKSYGIQIPPIGRSRCPCPPCIRKWSGGGDEVSHHHGTNPNEEGKGNLKEEGGGRG